MLFLCEPFFIFLGTAPTNVIEWLTVLQAEFSLETGVCNERHFDACALCGCVCILSHVSFATGPQAILFFCCCIFDTCFASPSKQKDNDVVDSSRLSCRQRTRCGFHWHSFRSASNPWGFRATLRKSSARIVCRNLHMFDKRRLTFPKRLLCINGNCVKGG